MADKKRDEKQKRRDERPHEDQEGNEGKSILVADQSSFLDEGARTGKQFADGGVKATELERVGAMSPDADAERQSERDLDRDLPPDEPESEPPTGPLRR